MRTQDTNIRRHAIAKLDLDQIAHDEIFSFQVALLAITNSQRLLQTQTRTNLTPLDTPRRIRTGGTLEKAIKLSVSVSCVARTCS